MSNVLDGVNIAGDLIKLYENDEYVFESGQARNAGASIDAVDITCQPVVLNATTGEFTFVEAGAENTANAIIAEKGRLTLADGTGTPQISTKKFRLLRRGPAVLWSDGQPTNDVRGAALNWTTIATTLTALSPPIITRTRAGLREVHTT